MPAPLVIMLLSQVAYMGSLVASRCSCVCWLNLEMGSITCSHCQLCMLFSLFVFHRSRSSALPVLVCWLSHHDHLLLELCIVHASGDEGVC